MANKTLWILLTTLLLCACGGGSSSNSSTLQNQGDVTAIISAPMVVRVNEKITLSAADSIANNDLPLSFQWFVIQEPGLGAAEVTSSSAPTTTLIASMEGVYRLRLKVSNGKASDIDEYELFATYKDDGRVFDNNDTLPPVLDVEEPGEGGAGEC